MKIPESIKVGPFSFAVKYEEDPRNDNDSKLMGQCDYGKQVIKINTNLGHPDAQYTVFLHELLHAIDWTMQAGLKEKQIDRMATGLAMVLKDNNLLREE